MYYYNVDSLMKALGQHHDPNEYNLFIDFSELNLKAVVLHNGNKYSSVLLVYAIHPQNSYITVHTILWNISIWINILGVYVKTWKWLWFCLIYNLAIWNSIVSFLNGTAEHGESHHSKKQWPLRQALTARQNKIPSVDLRLIEKKNSCRQLI